MMPFPSYRLPFAVNLWVAARLLPFFTRARRFDLILARATPESNYRAYQTLSSTQILAAVKRSVRRPIRMRGRRCLREGLLGFHYLALAGYRPVLHFGLIPNSLVAGRPRAHCWITLDGTSVLNPPQTPMVELFAYDGSAESGRIEGVRLETARYD